jgi:hypothetical protein
MYHIPNKLLYMAIPKTGSTSITRHIDLSFNFSGNDCIKTKHESCSFHPTIWDLDSNLLSEDTFFCTVVRNPYSRFVSHYFYCLHVIECWEKYESTPYGKEIIDRWKNSSLGSKIKELEEFKKNNPQRIGIQKNLYTDKPTDEYILIKEHFSGVKNFLDYVHKFHEMDWIESFFLRQVCFTHFAWNYRGPKMDFIGKTKDLQDCCDFICKSLNIESKKLPHLNKSKHKHWSEYYDYDAKKLIGLIYDVDFKYFGYEK